MEAFVKGDVIVVELPFSDGKGSKRRPALVVTPMQRADIIVCQISSAQHTDKYTIALEADDLKSGQLFKKSYIRINRIFTIAKNKVIRNIGSLKNNRQEQVTKKLIELFS